jgi:hypothetical protein
MQMTQMPCGQNVTSGKERNYSCIKYDPVEFVNAVRILTLRNRTTIPEMACFLGIPKTTVYQLSKKHLIKVSSHVKTALMDQNKLVRIEFCLRG